MEWNVETSLPSVGFIHNLFIQGAFDTSIVDESAATGYTSIITSENYSFESSLCSTSNLINKAPANSNLETLHCQFCLLSFEIELSELQQHFKTFYIFWRN